MLEGVVHCTVIKDTHMTTVIKDTHMTTVELIHIEETGADTCAMKSHDSKLLFVYLKSQTVHYRVSLLLQLRHLGCERSHVQF